MKSKFRPGDIPATLGPVDISTMLTITCGFSVIFCSQTSRDAALRFSKIDDFCLSLAKCQQGLESTAAEFKECARNNLLICSLIFGRSSNVPQLKNTGNRGPVPRLFLNRNVVIST